MSVTEIEEMGPIDYIVLEWPGKQPSGEVAPMIVDLADRGIIRVLDIAFMIKREDGTVDALEIGDLDGDGFADFEGASSGLIGQDDLEEAAAALSPGTTRRRARVGEPLGGPGRRRAAPLRRRARRQRAPARAGRRRIARGRRSRRPLNPRSQHDMPGLLRGVARTAVIAGTATSVSNRVSRRQANRWASQEQQQPQYEQQPTYAAPPPPPPRRGPDRQAQGAREPARPGHPHRPGVRRPEGEAARLSRARAPRGRSAVEQPDGAAARDRLRAAADVELAVGRQRLRLDRVGRDVQAVADLAEAQVAGQEAQHAQLGHRQRGQLAGLAGRERVGALPAVVQPLGQHRRVGHRAAAAARRGRAGRGRPRRR